MSKKQMDKKRYVEPQQRKAGPLTVALLVLGLAGFVFLAVLFLLGGIPVL